MKRALVLAILLVVPVAFGFSFSQEKGSVSVFPGDSETLNLKLRSDHYERVSITPLSLSGWYTMNDYIVELNNSEKNVTFYISVPKNANEANYLFKVKLDNSTHQEKILWIIRVSKGEVNKLSLKGFYFPERLEPGKTYTFRFDVENTGNTILYNVRLELGDSGGKIVRRQYVVDELRPGDLYRVSENFTVSSSARPENLSVSLVAYWNGMEMFRKETRTEIVPVERLERRKWGNIILLGYETVENITNTGNHEIEYNFTRNISAIGRLFATTNGRIVGSRIEWSGRLGVGESVELRYGWNVLPFLLALASISAVAIYLFRRFATPSISKDVKTGREIKVFLTVKNRSMGEIKDVVVRDYVIPLFRPEYAGHGPKPRIKKAKDRFVVSWRIARLLPGEERILEYRLHPVFGVKGKLDFGRAEMACRQENMVMKVKSNSVKKEVV